MDKLYKQDGEINREFTENEYAQHVKDEAENQVAIKAKASADAKLLADKAALLTKLGITPDEAQILLT